MQHKGAVVPDHELRVDFESKKPFKEVSAIQNGHRRVTADRSRPKRQWGGSRKKSDNATHCSYSIHPDALETAKAKMEFSKYLHDSFNKDEAAEAMKGFEWKRKVKAKVAS